MLFRSKTLFRPILETADLVIAPELIVSEVCSAFRKYVRARVMSRAQAEESIDQALALVDRIQPLHELVGEVLALAWRADSSVLRSLLSGTCATNGRYIADGGPCCAADRCQNGRRYLDLTAKSDIAMTPGSLSKSA